MTTFTIRSKLDQVLVITVRIWREGNIIVIVWGGFNQIRIVYKMQQSVSTLTAKLADRGVSNSLPVEW